MWVVEMVGTTGFKSAYEMAKLEVWEFLPYVDEWVKYLVVGENKEIKSKLKARLLLVKEMGFDIEKRLKAKLRDGTFF